MIPRVGDIVKLNPDFLKIWFKKNKYFRKEVWRENFRVIEIEDLKDEFRITFKSKYYHYGLFILPNGEFSSLSNEYKGI